MLKILMENLNGNEYMEIVENLRERNVKNHNDELDLINYLNNLGVNNIFSSVEEYQHMYNSIKKYNRVVNQHKNIIDKSFHFNKEKIERELNEIRTKFGPNYSIRVEPIENKYDREFDVVEHVKRIKQNKEKRNNNDLITDKLNKDVKEIIQSECAKYIDFYDPSLRKLMREWDLEEDFEMEKITLHYQFIKNIRDKKDCDLCDLLNMTHKLIVEDVPNMMENFINSNFTI